MEESEKRKKKNSRDIKKNGNKATVIHKEKKCVRA